MPTINPHLHFNGNTEEAFLFYKTVFGGEINKITTTANSMQTLYSIDFQKVQL
jgi:PhnB protein